MDAIRENIERMFKHHGPVRQDGVDVLNEMTDCKGIVNELLDEGILYTTKIVVCENESSLYWHRDMEHIQ